MFSRPQTVRPAGRYLATPQLQRLTCVWLLRPRCILSRLGRTGSGRKYSPKPS